MLPPIETDKINGGRLNVHIQTKKMGQKVKRSNNLLDTSMFFDQTYNFIEKGIKLMM